MTTDTIKIALNKLSTDPRNVRKTYNQDAIAELAASIEAKGLLQNIVVRKASKKGQFFVTAGARRLKALELLAENGKIAKDSEVNCLLRTEEEATEISLAENVMREAMHPADAYEAYAKLEAEGKSISAIAVKFGTTETMIRRYLSLGKVSPVLRNLYRDGEMKYEQLTAFTISDDHAEQERVWEEMQRFYHIEPSAIRSALSGEAVKYTDRRIKFIGGMAVYEAAGGAVKRDLFDDNESGYALDTLKVETLVAEKLAQVAGEIKGEGWLWVEAMPTVDYWHFHSYKRYYPDRVLAPEEDAAEYAKLSDEFYALEEQIEQDNADDDAEEKLNALQEKIEAFDNWQETYSAEVLAKCGVVISFNMQGGLIIERGLEKPVEPEKDENDDENDNLDHKAEPESETNTASQAKSLHSAALVQDLTAQKTAALRVELANNPDIALAAVVHALLLKVAYTGTSQRSVLEISLSCEHLESSLKDAASCRALEEMEKLKESYGDEIPGNPADLWEWCLNRKESQLLYLLAYAAARSVNAVETKYTDRQAAFAHANQLGEALSVDIRDWFEPTAASYFNHVNRNGIEIAVKEAAGEHAALAVKAAAKKSEAVLIAERLVKGTGWLPEHIRIKATQSTEPVSAIDDDEDENADNNNGDGPVEFEQAAE